MMLIRLVEFGYIQCKLPLRRAARKNRSENSSTLHDDESNNQKIHAIFRTSEFYQCINDGASSTQHTHTHKHTYAEPNREEPNQAKPIQGNAGTEPSQTESTTNESECEK